MKEVKEIKRVPTECPVCGCKDGNHAQECSNYYNAGYGKRL